ncbi:MAG: Sua5 family C-terminal domain-containing protein [Erysipelotrichaceae bacterium]|nr:Sua5 family C-terminal domain-containing protein [Erysipelotrichaceae bacterium]MDD3925017.1 Sua5 family C-terminal domain-containing protein [Erysipelotrichaceae bacterium]
MLLTKTKTDPKIAVLGPTNIISSLDTDIVIDLGSLDDLNTIAKNLFSAFRQLDQLEVKEAYIVAIPEIGIGKAIMNRVMKAANYQVIDV